MAELHHRCEPCLFADRAEVALAVELVAGGAAAVQLAGVGHLKVVQLGLAAGAVCGPMLPAMPPPSLQGDQHSAAMKC